MHEQILWAQNAEDGACRRFNPVPEGLDAEKGIKSDLIGISRYKKNRYAAARIL
ncbi:hypothetical protein GIW56_21955 [Pseudomonas gessardii]|uniref:Uncharacterized protein n=1 Tax=Pseudomonas gessardii TaxID=78544 RepID=A0ABS9FCN7_9PSED|nr:MULTISPECIES: hypothetical protein [Pseudomonas]MCF4980842.1 hypothetical protein [Pseudomonas gessardii]MCF4993452.1 hypothetical protein [Pseudomonas gessardii]MCF5086141.1 hypothetical protein [Pseudomonas gessardii]MCF5098225.1 hypothetical protein [Pseudomonas gessardii]MCF5109498.1 hypothetical protein [Pseudomonas gessardii]